MTFLIKYNDNIASEQVSCKNLVTSYLSYKYSDGKENSKVYWAIVILVAKASLYIKENTNLTPSILKEYDQFFLVFSE
jgi:hypothetical protein